MHPEAPWRGCHGVRLHGAELDLGTACGTPLADASVETIAGLSRPLPDTAPLWEASASIGGMTVAQRAWRRDDGSLVVHTDAGAAVDVDLDAGRVTVEAARPEVAAQLVATYALPLLVQHTASLVLHASAAVRPGAGAVLVCGRSGRGKSSTLVGLVDAGWAPISEDLAAVDLRAAPPVVWPGPPWVRRPRRDPGPRGASARFETPDKTAWDLAPVQVRAAVPVERIVVLDEPGGDAPRRTPVSRADAVALVAPHAVWLGAQSEVAARLFPSVLRVTAAVEIERVRVPRSAAWLDDVVALLS